MTQSLWLLALITACINHPLSCMDEQKTLAVALAPHIVDVITIPPGPNSNNAPRPKKKSKFPYYTGTAVVSILGLMALSGYIGYQLHTCDVQGNLCVINTTTTVNTYCTHDHAPNIHILNSLSSSTFQTAINNNYHHSLGKKQSALKQKLLSQPKIKNRQGEPKHGNMRKH